MEVSKYSSRKSSDGSKEDLLVKLVNIGILTPHVRNYVINATGAMQK